MARTAQIGKTRIGTAQIGSANTGGAAIPSFAISPSAGHTAGVITVTVQYSGGAICPASNPISVTGGGSVASWVQVVAGANGSGTIQFTEPAASGTPTVFSDSVTSTTQSFSNAAVVPGAPTIGAAIKGNTNATVAYTAPADNGGAAITTYTATSSPGGFTGTGASPITVAGLTNGTVYTFTVTATNSVGVGPPSAASNSVTPSTVPGTPTIGTATAGNASATVTFTPGSTGGATTTYVATSSPGGFTSSAGSASPLTVSGLTNGTAYTFTVVATNLNGSSAASGISNSVTPTSVLLATKLAPFVASDVITTAVAQAFSNISGTMTATGTPPTVNTVANISNGREASMAVTPNGADGSFFGVVRWNTGGGIYFVDELNIATVAHSVSLTTLTVTKVCNLPQGTNISGTIGYQLMSAANAAIGGRVTTGIIAVPLATGPDKFCADITLAPGSYFIVWDNGSGIYSQDEIVISDSVATASIRTVNGVVIGSIKSIAGVANV